VHDFRYPNGMHKSDDLKEPVRDLDNANTTQSSIAYFTSYRYGERCIRLLHRLQHAFKQTDMFAIHVDVYCLYCVLVDPI
jgi:hypothetical protein